MNDYGTVQSNDEDDDEFMTPRSSMSSRPSEDGDFSTPPQSEYDINKSSYNSTMSNPTSKTKKITKQLIEKRNPMGFSKYKDCSKMNIDVITNPRELHARYQSCCPSRQTPMGTWKTTSPFCKKLDNRYKMIINETNKPMIDEFNAVSANEARDSITRDSDLSTVDNNVLKGGSKRRRRTKSTRTKKRRRTKSTKKRTKSTRNKRRTNKTK